MFGTKHIFQHHNQQQQQQQQPLNSIEAVYVLGNTLLDSIQQFNDYPSKIKEHGETPYNDMVAEWEIFIQETEPIYKEYLKGHITYLKSVITEPLLLKKLDLIWLIVHTSKNLKYSVVRRLMASVLQKFNANTTTTTIILPNTVNKIKIKINKNKRKKINQENNIDAKDTNDDDDDANSDNDEAKKELIFKNNLENNECLIKSIHYYLKYRRYIISCINNLGFKENSDIGIELSKLKIQILINEIDPSDAIPRILFLQASVNKYKKKNKQ